MGIAEREQENLNFLLSEYLNSGAFEEDKEFLEMAHIGDYVTATLVGGQNGEPRQGVCVKDNQDGTIQVQGELGVYRCFNDSDVVVVAERDLFSDTRAFVEQVRKQL